jgi:hypothetical protein
VDDAVDRLPGPADLPLAASFLQSSVLVRFGGLPEDARGLYLEPSSFYQSVNPSQLCPECAILVYREDDKLELPLVSFVD